MIAGVVVAWLAGGGWAVVGPAVSSDEVAESGDATAPESASGDDAAESGDATAPESASGDDAAESGEATAPESASGDDGAGSGDAGTPGDTPSGEAGAATPMAPAPAPAPDAATSSSPPTGDGIVDSPTVESADGEPPPGPAVLPSAGPGEPQLGGATARGGASITPLPPPPPPEDPTTITAGPWRGRWWFSLGLGATIPVGGERPASGEVTAIVPELTFGYRPKPYLAVHFSASTASHDTEQQTVTLGDGTQVDEVDIGRLSAFDLATVRGYLPLRRRWQPWLEAGAGVGVYSAPFSEGRRAVGLVRTGLGADFWLAAKLTLSLHGAYRLAIIGNALGHSVRTMATVGLHW